MYTTNINRRCLWDKPDGRISILSKNVFNSIRLPHCQISVWVIMVTSLKYDIKWGWSVECEMLLVVTSESQIIENIHDGYHNFINHEFSTWDKPLKFGQFWKCSSSIFHKSPWQFKTPCSILISTFSTTPLLAFSWSSISL